MALYLNGKKVFGGTPLAEEVIYDNTDSGLTAENTQDAVDELASEKADKSAISNLITLSGKSGSIASFSTDIADKLFSCYVNVTAVQAGSGTPAPDNVRAISGWSACNLIGCQKNLVNMASLTNGLPNTTLGADITDILSTTRYSYSPIFVSPKTSCKLTSVKTNNPLKNLFVFGYKANKLVYYSGGLGATSTTQIDFSGFDYYRIAIGDADGNTMPTTLNGYGTMQLEVGSSATAYQAYNGTTHNIPFNTTVYGGVLDVLSGVLTVTHGFVDLGAWDWAYEDLGVVKMTTAQSTLKLRGNGICNMYIGGAENTNGGIWVSNSQAIPLIRIKDTAHFTSSSTPTDIKTFLTGGQAVFELYHPNVIQLTPTEVKTILGQNNIFGDCGDIDLKYLETIGNRL